MGIKIDILQDICNLATKQVQDLYPNLELMFIPHEPGQFHEIVATNEYEISRHSAGKVVQSILEKNNKRDLSSFLGMAVHREVKWLGLASRENILALFNINTEEFETPKAARRGIYHLIWHAIDLMDLRRRPEYSTKFRAGPLIPKRSPMNLAQLNLQADSFAAVMGALLGEEDALDVMAKERALDTLSPVHDRRAEDYPFVIAVEAAKYAYEEIVELKPARSKFLFYARHFAREIGHAFDDSSIRSWWAFSEPAQDLAWRNFSPEMILGCAINTSEDPFVRATGHLVSDITGIIPMPSLKLGSTYNAFMSSHHNQILHREVAEKTFADAVAQGVMEESSRPLSSAANEQNESLADGNILGWCANALQAAARAFESALSSGVSPVQAARMQFEGTKDLPDWDTLAKIGEGIVDQKRAGFAVTMGSVVELCGDKPGFAPVLNSIKFTLKDPAYIQKLETANDLVMRPSAPAPPTLAPAAPVPTAGYSAPAPSGPSLGGNANMARQRALLEKLRREQQAEKVTEDDRTK
jgi:hypothetical protein